MIGEQITWAVGILLIALTLLDRNSWLRGLLVRAVTHLFPGPRREPETDLAWRRGDVETALTAMRRLSTAMGEVGRSFRFRDMEQSAPVWRTEVRNVAPGEEPLEPGVQGEDGLTVIHVAARAPASPYSEGCYSFVDVSGDRPRFYIPGDDDGELVWADGSTDHSKDRMAILCGDTLVTLHAFRQPGLGDALRRLARLGQIRCADDVPPKLAQWIDDLTDEQRAQLAASFGFLDDKWLGAHRPVPTTTRRAVDI